MSKSIEDVLDLFEHCSFFASKAVDSLKMDVIKTAADLAPETYIKKPGRIKVGRPALERHITFGLGDYDESFEDRITESSFKFDKTMFFLILLNLYQKDLNKDLPMHYQVNFSNEYQEHVYRTYMEIELNNKTLNLMGKKSHTFDFSQRDKMQLETYEKQGVTVGVSARSKQQRRELVEDLDLENECGLESQGSFEAELVVNATPVAELPESPVKLEKHENGEWLLDVVFQEIETDIIKEAEKQGWKTTKGWRMLLHQALKQFELYTGEEAPEKEMGRVLKEGLAS